MPPLKHCLTDERIYTMSFRKYKRYIEEGDLVAVHIVSICLVNAAEDRTIHPLI